MTVATVTLEEILARAAARSASLVPETSGYLSLAIADAVSRLPFLVSDQTVTLSTEGTVAVARGATMTADDTARTVRATLARLLAVSIGSMPGLTSAARPRTAERSLASVVTDLEAALIPVNRAAARRALGRLARETLRAKELGKQSLAPPAKAVEPPLAKAVEQPPAVSGDSHVVLLGATDASAPPPRQRDASCAEPARTEAEQQLQDQRQAEREHEHEHRDDADDEDDALTALPPVAVLPSAVGAERADDVRIRLADIVAAAVPETITPPGYVRVPEPPLPQFPVEAAHDVEPVAPATALEAPSTPLPPVAFGPPPAQAMSSTRPRPQRAPETWSVPAATEHVWPVDPTPSCVGAYLPVLANGRRLPVELTPSQIGGQLPPIVLSARATTPSVSSTVVWMTALVDPTPTSVGMAWTRVDETTVTDDVLVLCARLETHERSRVDELVDRFGSSLSTGDDGVRALAASLKTMAGLEPTPPPPATAPWLEPGATDVE